MKRLGTGCLVALMFVLPQEVRADDQAVHGLLRYLEFAPGLPRHLAVFKNRWSVEEVKDGRLQHVSFLDRDAMGKVIRRFHAREVEVLRVDLEHNRLLLRLTDAEYDDGESKVWFRERALYVPIFASGWADEE